MFYLCKMGYLREMLINIGFILWKILWMFWVEGRFYIKKVIFIFFIYWLVNFGEVLERCFLGNFGIRMWLYILFIFELYCLVR